MTNNTYVNNKKAYFLNHTKLRFSQKKGLIFKESLIKIIKINNKLVIQEIIPEHDP